MVLGRPRRHCCSFCCRRLSKFVHRFLILHPLDSRDCAQLSYRNPPQTPDSPSVGFWKAPQALAPRVLAEDRQPAATSPPQLRLNGSIPERRPSQFAKDAWIAVVRFVWSPLSSWARASDLSRWRSGAKEMEPLHWWHASTGPPASSPNSLPATAVSDARLFSEPSFCPAASTSSQHHSSLLCSRRLKPVECLPEPSDWVPSSA